MSAEDAQAHSSQPQRRRQWAALQPPQQPLYVYPQHQEDPSHLVPPTPTSHEHSNVLSSFDYGASYNQMAQSSSLVPSSAPYLPPDTAQRPYAPYSRPGFSDRQQPSHDYFAASQHAFDPEVRAITNPSYAAPSIASAYTSPPFPHQLTEPGQARDYRARASLPVTTPDNVAPAFSTLNTSFYPTQASTGSNKRQRSEEQEEDAGDINGQMRGDTLQMSAAEKLKRACARCRGLKVRCHFRDDNDTCDRCIKASQECIIPGRKQRRPPPKRELLLAKIRDQAAQIQDLMGQLETIQMADRNVSLVTAGITMEFARSSTLGSPAGTLADSFGHGAEVASTLDTSSSRSHAESTISQESLEWISKARESLEAFGASIRLGGYSTAKKDLVDQDLEDSNSSDGEYHLAMESSGSDDETYADRLSHQRRGTIRDSRPQDKASPSGSKMVGLPGQASPFGMMAALSVGQTKSKGPASVISDGSDLGIAHEDFFRAPVDPDPMRLRPPGHRIPPLLRKNMITSVEAEKLFKIYFDWMNISVSLLDPKLYTAQQVYWRCPFLFTVICAIASRYDTERPDLYPTAMDSARHEAGVAFLIGQKRVEVVQAYYLLSLFPIPARRWEEDRSWIYLGQAIRVAMDMNLHHPNTAKPRSELHAREMLNRTRAWLNVFNLDRSLGSQFGKTTIISNADYVASHSHEWWNSSEYNLDNFDIHLCAYNAELRALSQFMMKVYSDREHPTGLNKEIDLGLLASETDDQLENLRQQWFSKFKQTDSNEPQNRFRIGLLRLAYSYARLVALAYGFQHAFGKSNTDVNPFLKRCISAASEVVNAMVDDIGRPSQRIYVRHGPESQTVFVAFSCAFLIKLLQPKYASYVSSEQRAEIIRTVERAVEFHSSPDIGVDDRHGPRLYARFIGGLLERVKTPPAKPPRSSRTKRRTQGTAAYELLPSNSLSPTATQPSPVNHFEPLPAQTITPFDHFAWSTDMDPSAPAGGSALGLTASEFFYAPLPFDRDLVESMQSLSSLSEMHEATLPGFGWMKQMPPADFAQYQQQWPTGV